ncbi:MAG: hypothetical protein ACI9TF_000157 [Paracrocinitomix sp.]|jgi:hypothetical protein
MKGAGFHVVQEVIEELFDAHSWDGRLDAADTDGAYTALGDYVDEELVATVAAASAATGQSANDVLRLVAYHRKSKLASLAEGLLSGISQIFDVATAVTVVPSKDESSTQFLLTVGE